MKTHDEDHFHKYVSANTALKILDTLTLRWSAPRLFNDPFDVQMDLRFDFDRATFKEAFRREVERLVLSDEEPQGNEEHHNFKYFKLMWRDRVAIRRDRARFSRILQEVLDLDQDQDQAVREEYRRDFSTFLAEFKVLSVAEAHDNLLMWAHYADYHRGAVIRLRCIPEQDTALCAAMPVTYSEKLPVMADLDDWVRRVTGQHYENDGERIFKRYILTKSAHWAYEKEWRVISNRENERAADYVQSPLLPVEIEAVYVGCRISDEAKSAIASRLCGQLGHVTLYEARKSETRFALNFIEVDNNRP
jgi:hypothetical protein